MSQLSVNYSIEEVDFYEMLDVVDACEALQPNPDKVQHQGYSNKKHQVPQDKSDLSLFALIKGIVPGKRCQELYLY